MNFPENCPCGSNKLYRNCCGKFLSGEMRAKTPEQLMRSRYTAYALGGFGKYLLESWHPATAHGLTADALSQKQLEWVRLVIHHKSQRGDHGTVEFSAWYVDDSGRESSMHERSEFRRIQGVWLYVGGIIT